MTDLAATVVDMNDSKPCAGRDVTFTADDRAFVYAVARRIVRDDDDAADAAQDALFAAFRHRAAFRGASRYRTWLHRIAVTAALSQLRRRKRCRTTAMDAIEEAAQLAAPAQASPEAAVAAAETGAIVRDHVARLDPRYADVLRLRLDDDLAEAEVARALGLSIPTVKIRGHRARAVLRETLAAAL